MKKIDRRIIAGCIGCLLLVLILVVSSNLSILAQAADSILRPALGSQKTIFLESLYFNSVDKVTRLTYPLEPHKNLPFSSSILTGTVSKQNTDTMVLFPLQIDTSLPPLHGEGNWQPIGLKRFPQSEVLARSFMRPDPQRPYAVVSFVKMDMHMLGIGIVAGTYYPGGVFHQYGPGVVPKTIQKANTLVAAFNGGFQEKDGAYGMVAGQKTYVPLRKNLPALLLFANGSAQFTLYHEQQLPSAVVAIRQNGPYLVENGKVTSFVEGGVDTWGRSITNTTYTWRSGLGITANGNLVYAVGNSLVPQTLARALVAAGAVNAIQLDINPPWVRYIIYQPQGNGMYTSVPLLTDMQNAGAAYLRGYNKDFFYVYKK